MTPRRSTVGVATVLVAVLTAAGCASTPAPGPAAGTPATPSAPATAPSSVPTGGGPTDRPTDEPMDEPASPGPALPEPAPTWDEAAAEQAAGRAVAFMRAFARPDLDAADWHAGIAGLMSPTGAELFAHVDPAAVPARAVTDPGEILDGSTASLAHVHVRTDAGPYLVTLTRTSATGPWLVEYADPID